MATSGSIDFTLTRDTLIKAAYQYTGYLGEGDTPSATQYSEAATLLNMMVKAWMADGMQLWATKRGYVLPTTGVSSGIFGTDNIVTAYTRTTLSAAAAASASTVVVTSATGISSGYAIGVELTDNTMHWTTVNGAPSGTTVTLTTALPSAASSGGDVYTYATTTRIVTPKRILDANILYPATGVGQIITQISQYQYYAFSNRTTASLPNQYFFDPQLSPSLYWYPRFNTGDAIIEFTFLRTFEDFDATGDNPDFPQEYYLALVVGLAALLSGKTGMDLKERQMLAAEAAAYKEQALGMNFPESSVNIQPA